ncbi:hypothetical protein HYX02_07215 [Candidatus Woesearchaeota archaeon]|nr:hypothetical protein [Candidatus Woesearchaeota archaeon]
MAKRGLVIFGFLVILTLIAIGCASGGGTDPKKDAANQEAQRRNSTAVVNETMRYNLSVCSAGAVCAQDGINCQSFGLATDPTACSKAPTLTCVCPEQTACILSKNSTAQGKNTPSITIHTGRCLTAKDITNAS